MADIPDDVVERALDVAWPNWRGKYQETNNYTRNEMRAAGRVFVEWERERIYALIEQYLGQEDLLDYLRSASDEPEKADG